MVNDNCIESQDIKNNISIKEISEKLKGAIFLTGVAGIFLFSGFNSAVSTLKKKNPESLKSSKLNENYNSGIELALRALRWGTFYSSISCGILFYSIWKISGANSFQEFRQKMGKFLPKIS